MRRHGARFGLRDDEPYPDPTPAGVYDWRDYGGLSLMRGNCNVCLRSCASLYHCHRCPYTVDTHRSTHGLCGECFDAHAHTVHDAPYGALEEATA